jgi:hypothetical protein
MMDIALDTGMRIKIYVPVPAGSRNLDFCKPYSQHMDE